MFDPGSRAPASLVEHRLRRGACAHLQIGEGQQRPNSRRGVVWDRAGNPQGLREVALLRRVHRKRSQQPREPAFRRWQHDATLFADDANGLGGLQGLVEGDIRSSLHSGRSLGGGDGIQHLAALECVFPTIGELQRRVERSLRILPTRGARLRRRDLPHRRNPDEQPVGKL